MRTILGVDAASREEMRLRLASFFCMVIGVAASRGVAVRFHWSQANSLEGSGNHSVADEGEHRVRTYVNESARERSGDRHDVTDDDRRRDGGDVSERIE